MKLYIRQKVFSFNDKFYVKDEYGQDKYLVEGEMFSIGKKLHVHDMSGTEIAYIEQRIPSLRFAYDVYVKDSYAAQIIREFSLFFPRYTVQGIGWSWTTEGSFMAHEYAVNCGGRPIVEIHKEWMTWGDCYELNIAHPDDELMALAVVLTIDCVIENQSN